MDCSASANTPRLRKPKAKHRKTATTTTATLQASAGDGGSSNGAFPDAGGSSAMSPTGTDWNMDSATTPANPELTTGRLRARMKHKRVEKQYRNRLSAQFERLLSVLPPDRFNTNSDDADFAAYAGDSGEGSGGFPSAGTQAAGSYISDGKTVTRAEVLDVAVRYIEESRLHGVS